MNSLTESDVRNGLKKLVHNSYYGMEVSNMNRVVKILMERDNLTKAEAETLLEEAREEILEADKWEMEDLMMDLLGLEPDYIMDIL